MTNAITLNINASNVVNLTPHDIVFIDVEENEFVVKPSGIIARVSVTIKVTGYMSVTTPTGTFTFPITENAYGEVENLPVGDGETIYIVSALVAGRVPNRTDVFIPNESVRDEKGRIIGCRSFGRI
jgi:hypothetical protein